VEIEDLLRAVRRVLDRTLTTAGDEVALFASSERGMPLTLEGRMSRPRSG